jgi:hypothetical protein
MFILLDNSLKFDKCHDEIKLQKCFVFATLCSESVYSLKAIHPFCAFSVIRNTIYLLTYSTEQSLSWEANQFSASQKFCKFYGTWKFITAFTSAHNLSLSWASSIQSTPPHPTSWRSILILSSHLHLGLPSGLFPSALYVTPISFFSILSPEQYWVSSTYH